MAVSMPLETTRALHVLHGDSVGIEPQRFTGGGFAGFNAADGGAVETDRGLFAGESDISLIIDGYSGRMFQNVKRGTARIHDAVFDIYNSLIEPIFDKWADRCNLDFI